jgi:carboxymethylenebutenolidase
MPPRLTASDFDQDLLILFDAYVHGDLDRRGFLTGAQKYAKAGVTAAGLLAALSPNFAAGQVVPKDDPRLKIEWITYDSPNGTGKVKGYLVRPASAGNNKLPAIVVIHENRGLNPHIEDIARRLALDGFMAFAPDALTPLGGYPGDEDKARELFAKLDQAKAREDFRAASLWLDARADSTGKLGAVGVCYGGGMEHWVSTHQQQQDACVRFYGNTPEPSEAVKVKAPLLVQQAEVDERINAAWPAYEAALKAAGVKYIAYRYPGTQHGFNNDTTPRFDAPAARLAWERTVAFFRQQLQAAPVAAAAPTVRLRGNIVRYQAAIGGPLPVLTVRTRSGELLELPVAGNVVVSEVYPIALESIKPGSYIGVGAMPQADGTQRAIAVTVFPETARGRGEGHRPFDLAPESTMTNATVADLVAAPEGRRIRLRYKDGEKTVIVPAEAPVVSFKPADQGLLVPGASVSLTTQEYQGRPTVIRISIGRSGFQLPY